MHSSSTISSNTFEEKINQAATLIKNADKIVIGIGKGLSEAAGMNFSDPDFIKIWYKQYYDIGFRYISEIKQNYLHPQEKRLECFWGFWSQHIWHTCYEEKPIQLYQLLGDIVKEKDCFLKTEYADSQIEKAGFSSAKIFSDQGDYSLFQCSAPCSEDLYHNKSKVEIMVKNLPTQYEVRAEDCPYCPKCNAPLIPNIRYFDSFVEKQRNWQRLAYSNFINSSAENKIVFIELGVDFKNPLSIRNPFEVLTKEIPHASLIRINNIFADVPRSIESKAVWFKDELSTVINALSVKIN